MEGRKFGDGTGGSVLDRPLLTLVIPTRNESENVPLLVRELRRGLADVDYRVIFVDDSTDDTPEVIRALSREDERVGIIHREGEERKGGLATAVTTGLDTVSEISVYTCVMDADLQHPPEKVREMLERAISSEADVVVASRYVKGGDYEGLSGPVRKAVSSGSKSLAQIVFREARKTSDPMSGFFLVKNSAISGIQFRPTGFKILLEVLVCAPELKVVEVPLRFQSRNAGVSKATLRQGLDYLSHIASLFWFVPSAGRFWKFALVGASGVLVNMATLFVLAEYVNADLIIAWMFAVGISILTNFLLNSAFTWRDVRHAGPIHFLLRGALAYPVAILGIGANFAVYYPLLRFVTEAFPYYLLFNFLGILAATSVNFILSSKLVFRPSRPRNAATAGSPGAVVEEVRRELKADTVGLVTVPEMIPLPEATEDASSSPLPAEESAIVNLVASTEQPTLTVTGPRRLPQARTNTRWVNSLAVPVFEERNVVGILYAVRTSAVPFTEEDLHWLTAYASTASDLFTEKPHNNPTRR
ncbi:glycosyltransferase [Rubrobacter radiotolerans]|uniref:Glycosyltransferase n=1 Tax=Rubrobacter radiotolerans TaxID=42256 RepID=A0AB35T5H6_RUBRA|nr:glycosyltransferase [Rubrobacter radiotolerans]MDX5893363.1 glycosyltransferase [Rubrobacter radiotolerans]